MIQNPKFKKSVDFIRALTPEEDSLYNDDKNEFEEDTQIKNMKRVHEFINRHNVELPNIDKFWGTTNFNIGKNTRNLIKQTAGVELFRLLSRYTFFIGVGRMFDSNQVIKDIEKRIT